jgi:hypothetical protein
VVGEVEALCRLAGEFADELKVFVDVQDGDANEFGGGGGESSAEEGPLVSSLSVLGQFFCRTATSLPAVPQID